MEGNKLYRCLGQIICPKQLNYVHFLTKVFHHKVTFLSRQTWMKALPTVPLAREESERPAKCRTWPKRHTSVTDYLSFSVLCFSMGCGIGYGYLHRIPIRESLELPPKPSTSPAPDGFSDVST